MKNEELKVQDLYNIFGTVAEKVGHKQDDELTVCKQGKLRVHCSSLRKNWMTKNYGGRGYLYIGQTRISFLPDPHDLFGKQLTLSIWHNDELVSEGIVTKKSLIPWNAEGKDFSEIGVKIEKEINDFIINDFEHILRVAKATDKEKLGYRQLIGAERI